MTVVVGVSPDDSGADAVALGALVARLLDQRITLVHVHPPTIDYPSIGHVDAEWGAFLAEQGNGLLDEATEQLARQWDCTEVDRRMVASRSVSRGLRGIAEELGATTVVIGSRPRHHEGRIVFGSVAHALLHGASQSVAMAPEGFRNVAPRALDRLVVGFSAAEESKETLRLASQAAANASIAIELLTVVLRATRIVNPRLGRDPEQAILSALVEQETAAQQEVLRDKGIKGRVVQGDTADDAMRAFDWHPGDAFVLGSSTRSMWNRVLLGETSHKLIRVSTVPVVILARTVETSGGLDD
jgi:nucleotide-binding universal stress UspA family protein